MREHFVVANFRGFCSIEQPYAAFFQHGGNVLILVEVQNEVRVGYATIDFAVFHACQKAVVAEYGNFRAELDEFSLHSVDFVQLRLVFVVGVDQNYTFHTANCSTKDGNSQLQIAAWQA